jgi:uncharacterized protein YwqG
MTTTGSEVWAFRERLEAAGLGRFADSLVEMARPAVRLVPDPAMLVRDRSTRLGGSPELPSSIAWPRDDDDPLSFVAQVNLADVAPYEAEGLLPRDGLLSFFYAAVKQEAWGFDPADHGSAAVLYVPATAETHTREPPTDLSHEGVFRPVSLQPQAETTFAPWESYDVETLGMTRDEGFAYAGICHERDDVIHRLLGHPDPVQGDMQVECQLVTNGLYCGDSTGYQDPRAADLRAGAAEWRLLLQIDSQDEAEMMWGDVGRIYYWITHADLVARDWALSWLILQCG